MVDFPAIVMLENSGEGISCPHLNYFGSSQVCFIYDYRGESFRQKLEPFANVTPRREDGKLIDKKVPTSLSKKVNQPQLVGGLNQPI